MKTTFKSILFGLFFLSTFSVNAQLSMGAKAGIRIASMTGFTAENFGEEGEEFRTENVIGVDVGAVLSYQVSSLFTIQPELSYVQKGVKIIGSEDGFGTEGILRVNNLELTALAKLTFGSGQVQGYFAAGPSFGYALDGKIESEVDLLGSPLKFKMDLDFDEMEFSRTDFGGILGAGVLFNAGPVNLFLDGRYAIGFTNLNTGDDDIESQNRGISLTFGVLVPVQ